MGSVQSFIDCPRCGQPNCLDDFYYKSGECYIFCVDCGYHESHTYKRDDNGKFVLKDANKPFAFDNIVPVSVMYKKPFGSYTINYTDDSAAMGTLVTKRDYERFAADVVSQSNNIVKVVLSRYLYKKIVKTDII